VNRREFRDLKNVCRNFAPFDRDFRLTIFIFIGVETSKKHKTLKCFQNVTEIIQNVRKR